MMRKMHWYKGSEPPILVAGMLPSVWETQEIDELSTSHRGQRVELSTKTFVMVIDDSATVRVIVATCLRRAGLTVGSFHDGIDAIKWLRQPDVCMPGLIFLDIGLPRLDGYDVARQLKAQPQLQATVIVMLSRYDGVVDRLKGRLAGAREHLTKPFTTHELLHVVETYLGLPLPVEHL